MKNIINLVVAVLLVFALNSCEVVGDIFGAGVYTGIFIVVAIIAVIIFLVAKIFRR